MKSVQLVFLFLVLQQIALLAQDQKITILHTNDTHSQIEPTDKKAPRNADMGGYARRSGVVKQIREQEKNVILLDAGDFSQGTPYFNFFGGRVEIRGHNLMKYDAVTLGNHEFDNGIDSLQMLLKMADFPVVVSNYQMDASPLKKFVKPYLVIQKGKVRIGVIGLGVNPAGLIMEKNYAGIQYLDPVKTAQNYAEMLKVKKKCDLVICLSHLGSDSTEIKINDFSLAHQTRNIDVIIGGHSHSMIENVKTLNANNQAVIIQQMGKSGLYIGRIDLLLSEKIKK